MSQSNPTGVADLCAEALERGELALFPACPFPMPPAGQLDFLRRQRGVALGHKDVCYDPARRKLSGVKAGHPSEARRVADVLAQFSAAAVTWLKGAVGAYAPGLVPDRVTLRTQEEATRPLRLTARNDLLHVDNFPTRPTAGRRILRLFVNINPADPQVWATSERFADLLHRYARRHGIPARTWAEWVAPAASVVRLFTAGRAGRSAYDAWMLRLHHFLKEDEAFQAQAARRLWTFPPGSMWLLFSDGVAHAQMRGRYSLEHSFFVPAECLVRPEDSPLAQLAVAGIAPRRAG
ncbi:MAG TPA: Kdo hydroxylase family protein [Gemmataceae bacterium]|nr:Kdo hydroxylase family protein [Gemmataceae bacterium]